MYGRNVRAIRLREAAKIEPLQYTEILQHHGSTECIDVVMLCVDAHFWTLGLGQDYRMAGCQIHAGVVQD